MNNKINWIAETTHPALMDPLRENLRQVMDPEIGLNVIELGLVRDVIVADESAHIVMVMTTPFCQKSRRSASASDNNRDEHGNVGSLYDGR
jgi:metal-sulfur cluster biosynthetic enzyme